MTEKEHIRALQRGEETAYELLIVQYQQQVVQVCYGFLRNREDAEDVAQEVFVEVYRSVGRFDGRAALSTWLYRIAVNKSLDYLKAAKRKKRFAPILRVIGFGGADAVDRLATAEAPGRPDHTAERMEQQAILMAAINRLPENQGKAFRLSKIDGLSQKEIAEIVGTTVSGVESLLHRAKQHLRNDLTSYYDNLKD